MVDRLVDKIGPWHDRWLPKSVRGAWLSLTGSSDLARSLVTATIASSGLWLTGSVITFAIGIIMARQLGPAGYGIYGTVLAIVALLGVPAQGGLPLLATREFAAAEANEDRAMMAGLLRWFTLLVIALSITTALTLLAVVVVFGRSFALDFRFALAWGSLLIPGFALCALFAGMIRGQGRVVRGQTLDVIARPLLFLAGLALLLLAGDHLDPETAVALQAIAALVAGIAGVLLVVAALPPHVGPRQAPKHHFRRWLISAAPMTLTEGMRQLDGAYGVLLVSLLATTADAGLYRVALSCLAVVSMPISLQNIVVAPYFSRCFASGDLRAVQRIASGSALFMTASVAVMTLALVVAGHWALGAAFGAKFVPAYLPLVILSCSQLAMAAFGSGVTLLSMTNREAVLSAIFAASVLVALLMAAALIPLLGANGAALAMLGGVTLRGVLINREARRSIGIRPSILSLLPVRR